MQQAAVLDCLSFDPFPLHEDCLAAPEVDVGRRQVADALVIAKVIVVGDEGVGFGFEIARQIVVLKQDAVLQRLVPALDLALGHWVIRRAANVVHVLAVEPSGEVSRDVARTVIRQEPRPVDDELWMNLGDEGLREAAYRGG